MEIIEEYDGNNKILCHNPHLINTKIDFKGKNNILICEDRVTIQNSTITFDGDNSIIYLSSNTNKYFLHITTNNNSVLYIDENCYFNNKIYIILSESKNVFIGKNCLFSFGIWIRLADPHLIYDIDTMRRINPSESICIGDHVWIGQDTLLLKGTKIGSGSIIGAKSLVPNKKIPSNCIWGGNPAKEIRKNVFFDEKSVHKYTKEQTENSMHYDNTRWIYNKSKYTLGFEYLEKINDKNTDEKIEFLIQIRNNSSHNRFYM
ncbi:acyltransferase [uncultured Methanobrevibacter sp.]|uniref:acyltransferase n=1 Tax=uncultured Methanobrevibacter sp. TaxID=253161 RepID=UPI0025FF3E32|nr:acyltransferase [uncultured Methanobrevibacter sp.]